MIGNPLTAQQWNDEFRTDVGAKVIEALMPFHERMPDLGKAPADAEERLRAALLAIGTDPKEIVIVSVSDLRASAPIIGGLVHNGLARSLVVGLSEEIRLREKSQLGNMLDKWRSASRREHLRGLFHEVGGTLHRSLFADAFKVTPFSCFLESSYLSYVRNFNLQRCLSYQVALLISGDQATAASVGNFSSLFASGVTPLVLLQDDTFIAVSA